eukprot:TRINITY_DN2850_c0_g1_i1.p1 TRINITY_DN2850_c0_g1~~TRINITY_DN2850_c0_g1_i1.p1  ORF type:complete len:616 (+),score=138.74 TRINITY_DN2850_c0_g1_i1:377-2224(+)
MNKLNKALKYYVCQRLSAMKYRYVDFYLSGSDVPGEGELKIVNYLLKFQGQERNDTFLIVGSDADLILQSLNIPLPNLTLLTTSNSKDNKHVWLSLRRCRNYFHQLFPRDAKRVMIDFVVLSILNGNDYLPKFFGSNQDKLWKRYQELKRSDLSYQYLYDINTSSVNIIFLERLVDKIQCRVPYPPLYLDDENFSIFEKQIQCLLNSKRKVATPNNEDVQGDQNELNNVKKELLIEEKNLHVEVEGDTEGEIEGEVEGEVEGEAEGEVEVEGEVGEVKVDGEVVDGEVVDGEVVDGEVEGVAEVKVDGEVVDGEAEGVTEVEIEGEGEIVEGEVEGEGEIEDEEEIEGDCVLDPGMIEKAWQSYDPNNHVKFYLEGLAWCTKSYLTGECGDIGWYYPYQVSPTNTAIKDFLKEGICSYVPAPMSTTEPLHPVQFCLTVLPPTAIGFIPSPLATLLSEEGSLRDLFYPPQRLISPKKLVSRVIDAVNSIPLNQYSNDEKECLFFGDILLLHYSFKETSFQAPNPPLAKFGPLYRPRNIDQITLDWRKVQNMKPHSRNHRRQPPNPNFNKPPGNGTPPRRPSPQHNPTNHKPTHDQTRRITPDPMGTQVTRLLKAYK